MSSSRRKTSQKKPVESVEDLPPATKRERRAWSAIEGKKVVDYLLSTIRKGKELEKPNAKAYYDRALEELKIPFCKVNQLKNYVKNLKDKYIAAVKWRGETGQGVLAEEGEESLQSKLERLVNFKTKLKQLNI